MAYQYPNLTALSPGIYDPNVAFYTGNGWDEATTQSNPNVYFAAVSDPLPSGVKSVTATGTFISRVLCSPGYDFGTLNPVLGSSFVFAAVGTSPSWSIGDGLLIPRSGTISNVTNTSPFSYTLDTSGYSGSDLRLYFYMGINIAFTNTFSFLGYTLKNLQLVYEIGGPAGWSFGPSWGQ